MIYCQRWNYQRIYKTTARERNHFQGKIKTKDKLEFYYEKLLQEIEARKKRFLCFFQNVR